MANTAVVGILRAMLTADTAQHDTSMRKSAKVQEQFGATVSKTGTQIRALTPQAERMVKSFQGDKLLYQANNITAAVQKLGGAQKLTAAEQTRVNGTLTQAIAKYKALGQTAPASMIALEKATRNAGKGTDFLSAKMVALGAAAGTLAAQFAGQLLRSLVNSTKQAIEFSGQLVDMSNQTGLSTRTLQRMDAVAGQTGTTLEALSNVAFRLNTRLSGGGDSVRQAVADLGLEFEKIRNQRIDQQFETILPALGKIKDESKRNEIAVELFGQRIAKVALGAARDYQAIANAAKISTDEQLQQLDIVGDRLDKLGKDINTFWRNQVADAAFAFDQFKKIGWGDLFKIGLATGMSPAGIAGVLAEGGSRAAKADADRKKAAEDRARATEQSTKKEIDYVAALKEAEGQLKNLDAAERKQIDAAKKSGIEQEELIELFIKFGVSAKHAETVLNLYDDSLKKTTKTTNTAANEWERFIERFTDASKRDVAVDLSKAIATRQIDLARVTKEQQRAILEALQDGAAAWKSWANVVPAEVNRALSSVQLIRLMRDELRALETTINEFAPVPPGDVAFAQLNVDRDMERAGSVVAALDTREAAEREHSQALREIELQRMAFAIRMAELHGAKKAEILQMESGLAAKQREADLQAAEDAFKERIAGLKRETVDGAAEYARREQEYQIHVGRINETWAQGEAERREMIRRETSFWASELGRIIADGAKQMARDATSGLFTTLTGFGSGDSGAKKRAREAKEHYEELRKSGKASAEAITRAFMEMREAEKDAQNSFSDRFGNWLSGLKRQFGSWIDDMVGAFTRQLIGGFMRALANSRLGQAITGWIMKAIPGLGGGGGVAGTAMDLGGGLLGKVPGLSGLLGLGGGLATAGFSTAAGGTLAASALTGSGLMAAATAAPAAITSAGAAGGALAGGAAAGGGLGATIGALATNPITIGAAAVLGMWKLGMFDGKPGDFSRRAFRNVTGREPKFHDGGMVGGVGEQWAKLLGGEGVLNQRATAAIGGRTGVNALNKGFWNYANLTAPRLFLPGISTTAAVSPNAMQRPSSDGGGAPGTIVFRVEAVDTEGFERVFNNKLIPLLKREVVMPRHGLVPLIQQRVLS